MIHLIFLTTSYPRYERDEASIFVARLAEALALRKDRIDVVVPLDTSEPVNECRNKVHIHRFKYRFGSRVGLAFDAGLVANLRARPWQFWQLLLLIFGLFRGAARLAQSESIVVANWILAAWAAALFNLLGGSRFIYIVRGQEMRLSGTIFGRILFYFPLNRASRIVCVSQAFADQLKGLFPRFSDKILFIPNGITVDSNAVMLSEDSGIKKPYLLMIGTVTPVKDLGRAIKLFAEGLSKKFHLVVIGRLRDKKYVQELESEVRRADLSDRVCFLGEVPPQNISGYLQGAAGFLATSIHEGMPNALLEAMALGKVVIVSDIAAHLEVVTDNESGMVLSGNAQNDASRIIEAFEDPAFQKKLGSAAMSRVKDRSWDNTASSYIEVFTHL